HSAAEPCRQSADQASAANSDQQRVRQLRLPFELQAEGSLPQKRLPLVIRVDLERAGGLDPALTRLQSVGITLAADHKLRSETADLLLLGCGTDRGDENLCPHPEPARGQRNRHAMIATRGSY